MKRFSEFFYKKMSQNKVFGDSLWKFNGSLAFEEAEKRIEESLRLYKSSDLDEREESLEIYFSDLTALEEIPGSIGKLEHLERIFLGYASRDGNVDRGCKNLTSLNPLENCKNIKYINISKTQVNDLSPLRSIYNLVEIDMEGIPTRSIEPISNLPNLKNIFMSSSGVQDVSPIGNLPLALLGKSMLISIKNTPAVKSDPKLQLLSQFEIEKSSQEIRDYLTGNHPAFDSKKDINRDTAIRDIAKFSTVSFEERHNKIYSVSKNDIPLQKIELRQEILDSILVHGNSLKIEADRLQVPVSFLTRIERYLSFVAERKSFLEIDSAMSFIRGSLTDKYLSDACDEGFMEGCKQLLTLHKGLSGTYLLDPVSLDQTTAAATQALPSEVALASSVELAELFSSTSLPVSFHESVTNISLRFNEYESAARELPATDGNLKRSVILMTGMLAALASFVTVQSWAVSDIGIAFLSKLNGVIVRILQGLGLL